jgi:cytochrome c oxidase cbb3-type subunit III
MRYARLGLGNVTWKPVAIFLCAFFLLNPHTIMARSRQAGLGDRGGGSGDAAGSVPEDITAFPSFDMAAVSRGAQVFSAQCASCHGADARGGTNLTVVDLIVSPLVLDDVAGHQLGDFLKIGRPEKNMPKFDLEETQVSDLAQWLHYTISKDTIRGFYVRPNVFPGDPKAGEAFFNGPVGKCNTCHSVTGDMKGVAAKYNHDNPSILAAILSGGSRFGRGGRGGGGTGATQSPTAITATVTLASGEKVVGYPDLMDDFVVQIRLPSGQTRTWLREGEWPKVTITNPLQAHVDLVLKYTDADLHNLAAYLESVK